MSNGLPVVWSGGLLLFGSATRFHLAYGFKAGGIPVRIVNHCPVVHDVFDIPRDGALADQDSVMAPFNSPADSARIQVSRRSCAAANLAGASRCLSCGCGDISSTGFTGLRRGLGALSSSQKPGSLIPVSNSSQRGSALPLSVYCLHSPVLLSCWREVQSHAQQNRHHENVGH